MQGFLKQLQNGSSFSSKQLEEIFVNIIDKKYSDIEIAAFLYGLSLRGENSDELYNLIRILRDRAVEISAPLGAVDVCGTGGDGRNSLNISTAVAFVVAACSIPVAKHGNRAVSSKSGSSDVLQELGINIMAPAKEMELSLKKCDIAFLFAPNYHKSLGAIAPIRAELKVRTIFNLIGPLLNPAGVKNQLLGVYSKDLFPIYSEVVKKLPFDKVILVNSFDAMDEVSISAKTNICEIENGKVKEYIFSPEDYGFNLADIKEIQGGDAKYNAAALLDIFNGKKNAYRDIVVINAAFALLAANHVADLKDAIKLAANAIDDGLALSKFEQMKEFLNNA